MLIIPTDPVQSRTFTIQLADQSCYIKLYQKTTGMYFDLSVAGVPKVQGKIVRNRVKLVRQPYLGFVGDLAFMDTVGNGDPNYRGLGSRWLFMYLEASDL
jgi:hypothetical protein